MQAITIGLDLAQALVSGSRGRRAGKIVVKRRLQRAEVVRILWSEDYQRRGPLAPDLEQYLAAHRVTADRAAFQAVRNVVGAGLLAAAKEFGCDLLVMGAYSHSRLRQLILGGVTRHVLEHATVPLMMHR